MKAIRHFKYTREIIQISRCMKAPHADRQRWAIRIGEDFGLGPINRWLIKWALRE